MNQAQVAPHGLGGRLPPEMAAKMAGTAQGFSMDLRKALELPFEPVDIGALPPLPDGKVLTYIKAPAVIRRMNDCFNSKWDLIIKGYEFFFQANVVVAHVQVVAGGVTKDGIGEKALTWGPLANGQQGLISPGNDLKIAVTDGFKKACTGLGVALDLYDGPQTVTPPPQQANAMQPTLGAQPPQAFQMQKICEFFEQHMTTPRPTWLQWFGLTDIAQMSVDLAGAIISGAHPIMKDILAKTGKQILTGIKANAA